MTSLASNHVHFYVNNPTAYSIAWSREASLNTIPAIDVTKYTWRPGLYSNASAFALASANAAFAFALAFECPEVGAFAFALAFES